jgi:hypothetical protein
MVTHAAADATVHEHPAPAVTPIVPLPPADEKAWFDGEIVYEHAAAASWEIDSGCPATLSVALRDATTPLAETVNWMVAGPVPATALVIATHAASAAAVHAHVAPVVNVAVPVPPDAVNACVLLLRL